MDHPPQIKGYLILDASYPKLKPMARDTSGAGLMRPSAQGCSTSPPVPSLMKPGRGGHGSVDLDPGTPKQLLPPWATPHFLRVHYRVTNLSHLPGTTLVLRCKGLHTSNPLIHGDTGGRAEGDWSPQVLAFDPPNLPRVW